MCRRGQYSYSRTLLLRLSLPRLPPPVSVLPTSSKPVGSCKRVGSPCLLAFGDGGSSEPLKTKLLLRLSLSCGGEAGSVGIRGSGSSVKETAMSGVGAANDKPARGGLLPEGF